MPLNNVSCREYMTTTVVKKVLDDMKKSLCNNSIIRNI